MAARVSVNAISLIDEVKQRPCLYDNRGSHGNHELKNKAWGEIGAAIFKDKWPELSLQEKDALVKELQVKWKSLRDNFSRQLRLMDQARTGTGTGPVRKYIYSDRLSFLSPYINKRDKTTIPPPEETKETDSMFVIEEHKPFSNINFDDTSDSTSQPQVHFVPIQPKPQRIDMNHMGLSESSGEPSANKIAHCLSELVAMQKEDKAEDPMGNRRFLLSLLPFMKKLPDDVNLEVRLQLMSVLQTYCNGKGLQN